MKSDDIVWCMLELGLIGEGGGGGGHDPMVFKIIKHLLQMVSLQE